MAETAAGTEAQRLENTTRIFVIGGHYGVGKSEVSVALARRFRRRDPGRPVTLIDLDVVNPYFRSREARTVLEREGVTVIGNSLGIDTGVDLPAIPGSVSASFRNDASRVIVDLGGDPAGARALRQFRPVIPSDDTAFLYVFNLFRPENRDAETTISSLRSIENVVGLQCSGIINNSHMLHETEIRHIEEGDRLARTVSSAVDIPVVYISAVMTLIDRLGKSDAKRVAGEYIEIGSVLRQDWMNTTDIHTRRK